MSTSHQTSALLETMPAVQPIYSRAATIEQRQNDGTFPCMARLCAGACQRRVTRWLDVLQTKAPLNSAHDARLGSVTGWIMGGLS